MADVDQILEWAFALTTELERDMHWETSDFGGYWSANDEPARAQIRARAIAGLDFLERVSGRDSEWTTGARAAFTNQGEHQSMESGVRAIAALIAEWAHQVRSGRLQPLVLEARGLRSVASVDLMEQVRQLNADASVSPAAAIVLAGAALEVALRSAVEELDLMVDGQPSIGAYARALRSHDILGKQDMKDIEQMAGLRNDAAHGRHESLSRERAGLMEQQVNILLARLPELLPE